MLRQCDLFCRIIDNYGDIGVCWRLARQLATEHGLDVALWVDDLAVFARLAPGLDPKAGEQRLGNITVRRWDEESIANARPGDLVIEGFGCPLPPAFLARIAARQPAPCWLNLEYLSAEDWVADCHGLASPHPATGLVQHFWFPGFMPRTGGLLREAGLLAERDRFQQSTQEQAAFWSRLGLPEAPGHTRRLSLFSYENPAVPGLLDALAQATETTLLAVPEGRVLADVSAWAGRPLQPGQRLQQGPLTLAVLPLLPHEDYDRLLWACDLNLVRGEDSFVRAQWAGRPLLWHIYPQEDAAHLVKLEAFIRTMEQEVAPSPFWANAMRHWNGDSPAVPPWPALLSHLPALAIHARNWCARLARQPDLTTQVMHFCASRLE